MNPIDRTQAWQQITHHDSPWDLIIVGGGITGVGVLREAARLGLKSLLVEQKDYAWGTSSRSSKMVHGGLRYIAQGDIKLLQHGLSLGIGSPGGAPGDKHHIAGNHGPAVGGACRGYVWILLPYQWHHSTPMFMYHDFKTILIKSPD